MGNIIRKSVTPFYGLILAGIFLIIGLILVISNVSHAEDNSSIPDGGRLLTVHDRGQEKIFISRSSTVGDALKEAGIVVDSKDLVEPSVDKQLVASDYQINIYRARPVIVVDGNTKIKVVTAYQTPEQIVQVAGISLFDEDIVTIDRSDNLISDGIGLQLNIKRAIPFQFMIYGKTSTIRTQATTVGEMLKEKNIVLRSDDRVSVDLDTKIDSNLSIRLWREGKQTVTTEELVPFETDKIKNADYPLGYKEIKTAGVEGTRSVSYEITIQDGREVGRVEIASVSIKNPVKQVEIIGAKGEYTTPSENENITWDFLISNGFSRNQTAGIMGNLMQEHRFNTSDTSGGYGIVQWTGSRRSELLTLAYPENIYTQLGFLMTELNGKYAGIRDQIKATNSVDEAVQIFQNKFERCGICMESQRIKYAYNILASH